MSAASRSATSAPRDGLQNDRTTLEPQVRAELVDRLAAAGLAADRGGQLRQSRRACRRWRARRRSSRRSTAGEGVVYAGLVLNERGYDRLVATGPRRGALRLRGDGDVQPAQRRTRPSRSRSQAARADRRARARGRDPRDRDDRRRVRLPVRGRRRPGASLGARRRARRGAAPTRSCSPTRSASACRARCASSSAEARRSASRSASTCTTRATPASRTRTRRSRPGATVLDASVGGIGGCPFAPRATGNIATEDLVYLLHGEGVETGIDLDALDRRRRVARRRSSGGSSKVRSTAPARSRRSPAEQEETRWRTGSGSTSGAPSPTSSSSATGTAARQFRVKTPSTPADPSEGVLTGVRRICDEAGIGVGEHAATSSTARPSRRTRCSSRRAPASA